MGRRGPGKTPVDDVRRKGNPGRRPLNEREPRAVPGAPPLPSHYDEEHEATWHWLCAELAAMTPSVLATSDLAYVMLYCDAWSHYLAAERTLEDESAVALSEKGASYITAYAQLRKMYANELASYAKELGLSPTARPGISAGKPADAGGGKFFKVVRA